MVGPTEDYSCYHPGGVIRTKWVEGYAQEIAIVNEYLLVRAAKSGFDI